MEKKRNIRVFLDEETTPFGEFTPPAKIVLDTTKIKDGKHTLKIIARSSKGIEGVKEIPFEVRNGPQISVVGLKDNEIIDSQNSILINAYGNESTKNFLIEGSETPKPIPSWIWACVLLFIGFGIFYSIWLWNSSNYTSFF